MLLLRFWALASAGHGGCREEMERGGAALLGGGGEEIEREKGETLGRGCWLKRRGEDGATSASVKLTMRARALCLWNRDGDATGQVVVNRVGPGGLR